MRTLLAVLVAVSPVIAADQVPAPVPQAPTPARSPALNPAQMDLMKELRAIDDQMRTMRQKTDVDPELIKLRSAAEEAQKAYRAKSEELIAKDPGYAALKTKRDELRAKFSAQLAAQRAQAATAPASASAPQSASEPQSAFEPQSAPAPQSAAKPQAAPASK